MDLQLVETIIIILDGRRNILDGGSPDLGEAPRARRSRCAAAHATRRSEDPRWGHLAVAKEARRAALQAIVWVCEANEAARMCVELGVGCVMSA